MNSRLAAYILGLTLLFGLASCKPSVPDTYIQPDELEDILYEYHLARAMSDQGGGDKDMVAYKAAILNKYGYTEAELDSSMYYYVRHTKLMRTVYEHLSDRLSKEALALGASANDIRKYGSGDLSGDTANVWTGQRSIVLMPGKATCLSTYEVKVDTSFHAGDKLSLDFSGQFIYQEGVRDGIAVMAVRFANDSVAQSVCHVSSASNYSLTITDTKRLGIKSIKGFFMLNNKGETQTTLRLLFIDGIRLIRMHQKPLPQTDNTAKDSVKAPDNAPKAAPQLQLQTNQAGRKMEPIKID